MCSAVAGMYYHAWFRIRDDAESNDLACDGAVSDQDEVSFDHFLNAGLRFATSFVLYDGGCLGADIQDVGYQY